ncbi:MAG: endonuclease VIII, partial [Proteobacteria bacterium]
IDVLGARAVRTGGITLDDKRLAAAKAQRAPRRDTRHFVYGRAGRPCLRCETSVVRAEIGGRHLFVCPTCQGWPARS